MKFPKLGESTYKASATKPMPPFEGKRKPLIAGNWKMNLNHLEAIALTQKLAFSLKEELFADTEVVVLPPFVDIRSVQTLIDGDHLLIGYGAQDSRRTTPVRTPATSADRCSPSSAAATSSSGTPSAASTTTRTTRS